ncbi:MAG TPA: GntR family transcriptional regulator [Candidatus Hydrogenedentes bacterium]|jgi:GntR family transcriptional regulator|nr:MAG: HTH-type transcriptional repressor YtrA [Candidatus Hydrogenedentes bacterium ADurb.Bin101]HQN01219.1 GntR family transcriptional regulator [Candidatus Hydrogenedentota bacterium]
MKLHINPKEGKPIYRQIMDQVKYLIASGRLSPGDELPTVRGLAQDLLINPNTVARAYRELEQAGILVTRQGAGTYVSTQGTPLSREACGRLLLERARALAAEAWHLGYRLEDTLSLLRRAHEEQQAEQHNDKEDTP